MNNCTGNCNQGRMCDCADKTWLRERPYTLMDAIGIVLMCVLFLIAPVALWVVL